MITESTPATSLSDQNHYPPSWFDAFSSRVANLPGPSWIAYLALVLLLAAVGALVQLFENPIRPVVFPAIAFLTYFQIFYVLSLMDYLDKRAVRALDSFRPILMGDGSQYLYLKKHLTTLPARPTRILTICVILFFALLGVAIFFTAAPSRAVVSPSVDLFTKTPTGFYSYLVFSIVWIVNSKFIFKIIRQMKAIDHAYTQCSEINLFRQNELYALSSLSATTGIGLVLSSPVWLILDPGIVTLVINVVFAVMAVVIFVSPLLGAHRLLRSQKDNLIKDSLGKKEELIRDLFSRIEDKDFGEIESYQRALSSLEMAHGEIERISTWPWNPETIRQVIGAIILPLTIWIVQFYLNQLLTN